MQDVETDTNHCTSGTYVLRFHDQKSFDETNTQQFFTNTGTMDAAYRDAMSPPCVRQRGATVRDILEHSDKAKYVVFIISFKYLGIPNIVQHYEMTRSNTGTGSDFDIDRFVTMFEGS